MSRWGPHPQDQGHGAKGKTPSRPDGRPGRVGADPVSPYHEFALDFAAVVARMGGVPAREG